MWARVFDRFTFLRVLLRNTTDSNHSLPVADNILDRQFDPTGPNEKWVGDITYIPTRGLELRSDLGFLDDAATMRASIGQRRLKSFIDMVRRGGGAMAVTAVCGSGFSPRPPGLRLGRPFGERGRLTFGLPAELFQFRQRLVPFALEAFVLFLEAFVLSKKCGDSSAEVGQFRKDGY